MMMIERGRRRGRGFTLIEVIVAAALFLVMMSALFQLISRIHWHDEQLQALSDLRWMSRVIIARFQKDLPYSDFVEVVGPEPNDPNDPNSIHSQWPWLRFYLMTTDPNDTGQSVSTGPYRYIVGAYSSGEFGHPILRLQQHIDPLASEPTAWEDWISIADQSVGLGDPNDPNFPGEEPAPICSWVEEISFEKDDYLLTVFLRLRKQLATIDQDAGPRFVEHIEQVDITLRNTPAP